MKAPGSGMNNPPKKPSGDAAEAHKFQTITGKFENPDGTFEKVRTVGAPFSGPGGKMLIQIELGDVDTGSTFIPWEKFTPDTFPTIPEAELGLEPEPAAPAPTPPSKAAPSPAPAPITADSKSWGATGQSPLDALRSTIAGLRGGKQQEAPIAEETPESDLTPAERAKRERVKLSEMIGTFKELMKKPDIETVAMTSQEVLKDRREMRAQDFAEKHGLSQNRRELKAVGDTLQSEYEKFYKGITPLTFAREKLGLKPASLLAAEKAFAAASGTYGESLLNAASGSSDIERKRAIAFNLRDTTYGREEMRIVARESAQNEKQKTWYGKALGWTGKGAAWLGKTYQSGTETVGRGLAAGVAMSQGETVETLDKAAFEKNANFYANATRLLGSAALGAAAFSATPLGALGFGGNLVWRVGRGMVGTIAGRAFAQKAQQAWKESSEANTIQGLKEFRKKANFTPEEVLAFQNAYQSGNVTARRNKRALVGTMAAIAGGAGTTGMIVGAESISMNMVNAPAVGEYMAEKITGAARATSDAVEQLSGRAADATEGVREQIGRQTITVPFGTPDATPDAIPAAERVPVQPPVEAPPVAPVAAPVVVEAPPPAAPSEAPVVTAEAPPAAPVTPPVEAAPDAAPAAERVPVQPEAPGTRIESVAERGDGYDRMFSELREQLERQYAGVAPADIPPTAQHILAASHENVLSREFGLAWDDATDNSASAPVEVGDKLVLDGGRLVLVHADGVEQEFMKATGERVYTFNADAAVEAPAASVDEAAPVPPIETPVPVEATPITPAAPPVVEASGIDLASPASEVAASSAPVPGVTSDIPAGDAPRPIDTSVGEPPRRIGDLPQGASGVELAFAPNIHGVVVDPRVPTLLEWDMPGLDNNGYFANGPVTTQFLEQQARLHPGVPILYEHIETNMLGVVTRELRAVMLNTNGVIEELPREVTNRIRPPNPNDFVRNLSS